MSNQSRDHFIPPLYNKYWRTANTAPSRPKISKALIRDGSLTIELKICKYMLTLFTEIMRSRSG